MSVSVFSGSYNNVWKYQFAATLEVQHLVGGTPSDPNVAAGWLKSRLGGDVLKDQHLADMVMKTMNERGVDLDAAIGEVAGNVNGFKRDAGGLVLEGRCAKSCIRESFSVALAGGHIPKMGWGATKKGLLSFVAEHVMIPEQFIPICDLAGKQLKAPTAVQQRFVSTYRGQGISYEEFTAPCTLSFTVLSDYDFDAHWPIVWTLAEQQGIGSTRSQGFGKFVTVRWDAIKPKRPRKSA